MTYTISRRTQREKTLKQKVFVAELKKKKLNALISFPYLCYGDINRPPF